MGSRRGEGERRARSFREAIVPVLKAIERLKTAGTVEVVDAVTERDNRSTITIRVTIEWGQAERGG